VKAALREIVDAVLSGEISTQADLERWKRKAGREFCLSDLPKNADIRRRGR